MAEYIEREALVKEISDICHTAPMTYAGGLALALNSVRSAPAADVQPVVWCADCKWFQCNLRPDGHLPDGVCEFECRYWCVACDPTDYCSHGAKMDGEADA